MTELDRHIEWLKARMTTQAFEEDYIRFIIKEYAQKYHANICEEYNRNNIIKSVSERIGIEFKYMKFVFDRIRDNDNVDSQDVRQLTEFGIPMIRILAIDGDCVELLERINNKNISHEDFWNDFTEYYKE